MGAPETYSVAAGLNLILPGPIYSVAIVDFADDCKLSFDQGEANPVQGYQVFNAVNQPFRRVRLYGGANAGMTVQVLQEEGQLAPVFGKKSSRVTAGPIFKSKALGTVAPAVAADSFFAVPASYVGGLIHVVVKDLVNPRSLRKWVLSNGVWYPAGTAGPTDPANDCTIDLPITTQIDGFFLQVNDAFGALTADINIEVPL
jgi:hypothetical protein